LDENVKSSSNAAQLARAVEFHRSGRLAEAARGYREVLSRDPRQFDALNLLGLVEHAQGRWAEALSCFDRAIGVSPGQAAAHFNRGNTLTAFGRGAEAVAAYRAALQLQPVYAEALLNLGAALHQQGDVAGAVATFTEMTVRFPGEALGHYNLGRCQAEQGQSAAAESSLNRALALQPTHTDSMITLAKLQADTDRLSAAIATLKHAIKLNSKNETAWMNLGSYLGATDDFAGAERAYQRALDIAPGSAATRVNLAIARFTQGRLGDAWDDYAVRADSKGSFTFRKLDLRWPPWLGEPLSSKKILVWGEQGLGDQVLFSSIIPEIAAEAGACTFGCSTRLVKLFRRSFPNVGVEPLDDVLATERARHFDYQISVLDLGRWRRRTLSALGNRGAYLKADLVAVEQARKRWRDMTQAGSKKLVGFSWRSFAPHVGDKKTPPLEYWDQLITPDASALVSLQYGPPDQVESECSALSRSIGQRIYVDQSVNFSADMDEASAHIAAMDCVVTVSNTTAHLSAALGVPTRVIVPSGKARLWYWLKEGTFSPWYPSVRLVRRR
jgi:tetratricopeptide (TPR) repeat protein